MTATPPAGVPCPACGSTPMSPAGSLHGHPLLGCPACGHDTLWVGRIDRDALYGDHYVGFREDPVFNRRIREVFEASIAPLLPASGRLLDVGCGNGELLQAARERGHDALGLDFSQAAAEACKKRGLRAIAGDFLDHDFGADAPFDLVTMWDVCEHLPQPIELMERARELLVPGGWVVLKVPVFTPRSMWLATHVPRVAGGLLGSPSHIQFFRSENLVTLLRRAGFPLVYAQPIARMRSESDGGSLFRRGKRALVASLARLSRQSNVLVRAQKG